MSNNQNATLEYYNAHAAKFVAGTVDVEFKQMQDRFLELLPKDAKLLDFGCGSGRDTKYFLDSGFDVDAIDGSEKMCEMASEFTGIVVKQMLFQDLNDVEKYDGIWACSSILHLSKEDLKEVMEKMAVALKSQGRVYTSFKYGDFEGERKGRYFTDFTIGSFKKFMEEIPELVIETEWITTDARPERADESWLNVILKKAEVC